MLSPFFICLFFGLERIVWRDAFKYTSFNLSRWRVHDFKRNNVYRPSKRTVISVRRFPCTKTASPPTDSVNGFKSNAFIAVTFMTAKVIATKSRRDANGTELPV